MNLYFIVEFRRCLYLSSAPIGTCPSVMCNAFFHFQIKIRKISCRHTRSTKYPERKAGTVGKLQKPRSSGIFPDMLKPGTTATPRAASIKKKMLLYFTYELRSTLKSFTLFITVRTNANLGHSDKFEIKVSSSRFTFSRRGNWSFHVVVLQRTAKKCTKNYNACAELLFCSLNLLFRDLPLVITVVVFLKAPFIWSRVPETTLPLSYPGRFNFYLCRCKI